MKTENAHVVMYWIVVSLLIGVIAVLASLGNMPWFL